MTHATPAAVTLCIGRCKPTDFGHGLGLKSGDVLVAVNGRRWTGSVDSLRAHFSTGADPAAMTFQRGAVVWTVLTDRLDLAQWDRMPAPAAGPTLPGSTESLCNWEIVADADGTHDLFPLRPSLGALVAPALWLAQQRLWTLLATLGAILAVALPAGVPVMAALWVAAGLLLWRTGPDHVRADRVASGFHRVGVVAARSESEAIATWESLSPKARFRFETEMLMSELPSAT